MRQRRLPGKGRGSQPVAQLARGRVCVQHSLRVGGRSAECELAEVNSASHVGRMEGVADVGVLA